MPRLAFAIALLFAASTASAFERIETRDRFLSLVEGRVLFLGLLNAQLDVRSDGTIGGSARNRDVTGSWSWQDGYFCREMDWSGRVIPYNCQLVELDAPDRVRFTVNRGSGQAATFQLR